MAANPIGRRPANAASRARNWSRFVEHLQAAPAQLPSGVRREVFVAADRDDFRDVPNDLASFVRAVARHAYRVTDTDIGRLRDAGRSEDEILEAAIAAAAGSGQRRLRAARAAMGGGE